MCLKRALPMVNALKFSDEEVGTARRIVSRYAENNADKEIDELYGR